MGRLYSDGKFQPWVTVNTGSSKLVDGGDPNVFTFLAHSLANSGDGIAPQLAYLRLLNRSGGGIVAGLAARISKPLWLAGQWTHGTTTFTDDTTNFQNSATTTSALETTTNGDGFLVACKEKFSAIDILMQTASTGSPVRVIEYSAPGGAWVAVGTPHASNMATNYPASNSEALQWFQSEDAWVQMVSGHGTNVPVGYYGIRIRATTAPTVAGVAKSITIHQVYFPTVNLANNTTMEFNGSGHYIPLTRNCDGLSMITNVGSARNHIMALVRTRGL